MKTPDLLYLLCLVGMGVGLVTTPSHGQRPDRVPPEIVSRFAERAVQRLRQQNVDAGAVRSELDSSIVHALLRSRRAEPPGTRFNGAEAERNLDLFVDALVPVLRPPASGSEARRPITPGPGQISRAFIAIGRGCKWKPWCEPQPPAP